MNASYCSQEDANLAKLVVESLWQPLAWPFDGDLEKLGGWLKPSDIMKTPTLACWETWPALAWWGICCWETCWETC